MNWIDEQQLTNVLRRSGRLTQGEVLSVTVGGAPGPTIMSSIFELEIQYSPDSLGDLPDNCLLKIADSEMFHIGRAEVDFYRFIASTGPAACVDCYGTFVDETEQTAFMLLEYRRDPCVQTEWPLPPDFATCARAVEALAGIHAHWWGSESAIRIFQGDQKPLWNQERLNARATALFDKLGDALTGQRRELIETLVARFPTLHATRLQEGGRHTVVHGDAHVWNFLIPSDTTKPPALIDWQLWGVDFGAADLTYMMALHWFPERRERMERELVQTWTGALQRHGVDCDFDTAWEDYRFLATGLLPRVVNYAAVIPANIWWPHLERAFLAFEDLDCAEFVR
jgi:hypothetical protein